MLRNNIWCACIQGRQLQLQFFLQFPDGRIRRGPRFTSSSTPAVSWRSTIRLVRRRRHSRDSRPLAATLTATPVPRDKLSRTRRGWWCIRGSDVVPRASLLSFPIFSSTSLSFSLCLAALTSSSLFFLSSSVNQSGDVIANNNKYFFYWFFFL